MFSLSFDEIFGLTMSNYSTGCHTIFGLTMSYYSTDFYTPFGYTVSYYSVTSDKTEIWQKQKFRIRKMLINMFYNS